jgi:hypothetical protein
MNDHGIMFTGAMVRALLAGRKDVTRRTSDVWARRKPGDRLWVKETWRTPAMLNAMSPRGIAEWCREAGYERPWCPIRFVADDAYNNAIKHGHIAAEWGGWSSRLRPSLMMPRWASRTLLEVVSVTREPGTGEDGRELPAVTDNEAIREGVHFDGTGWTWDARAPTYSTPRLAYLALFRSINPGPMPDHLWRIEFRRVEAPHA